MNLLMDIGAGTSIDELLRQTGSGELTSLTADAQR